MTFKNIKLFITLIFFEVIIINMCFNAICVETKSLSAISLTEKSNKKDDEKNFKRGIRNVLLKGEENSTSNNNRNSYNGKGNGANVKREQLFDKTPRSGNGPKVWDHWGKWSQCTVTCGVGKITRWRHCVSGGCASGEKEAQIKTCTLSAC